MTRESKAVHASEVYSRRVHSPVNTNGFHAAKHSPELDKVSDNLHTAVEAARQNGSDVKIVADSMKGIYATGVMETMGAKAAVYATENMAEASADLIRDTRIIFTDKETRKQIKNNRATYKNYYKAKKEKRKTANAIKKAQKDFEQKRMELDEQLESGKISEHTYNLRTNMARKNLSQFKREQKEKLTDIENKKKRIGKNIVHKRHTRAVHAFRHRTWISVKTSGFMLAKYPSKAAIMIADDMEADKLVMKGAFTTGALVSGLFHNVAMIAVQAIKSVLMMLSPIMLITLVLFFGIYIVFFSPLSTEFGINLFSNDMESSEIVRNAVTSRRQQLAEEFLMAEPDATVYFVTLDEDTVTDGNDFMKVVARNMYVSEIEMKDWLSDSDEGGHYLNYLAGIMCYRLTDEEAAVYPEENLEAYSGNIQSAPEPETTRPESTQPGAGGGIVIGGNIGIGTGSGAATGGDGTQAGHSDKKVVIGYHTTEWLLENHLLGELEDLYLNTTTIYTPAMYSIGRAFVEGGFISE